MAFCLCVPFCWLCVIERLYEKKEKGRKKAIFSMSSSSTCTAAHAQTVTSAHARPHSTRPHATPPEGDRKKKKTKNAAWRFLVAAVPSVWRSPLSASVCANDEKGSKWTTQPHLLPRKKSTRRRRSNRMTARRHKGREKGQEKKQWMGFFFFLFYKELPSSLQDTEAEEERWGEKKTNQSVHNPFNAWWI